MLCITSNHRRGVYGERTLMFTRGQVGLGRAWRCTRRLYAQRMLSMLRDAKPKPCLRGEKSSGKNPRIIRNKGSA